MSIRCSGVASRSFIIGIRLWPPAMIRAPGAEPLQRRDRALDAGRALVLNGAGVCISASSPPVVPRVARRRHPLRRERRVSSSLGSYCTGESVPITGERGITSGRVWRTSG